MLFLLQFLRRERSLLSGHRCQAGRNWPNGAMRLVGRPFDRNLAGLMFHRNVMERAPSGIDAFAGAAELRSLAYCPE
jgi:hypothetical protein